MGPNGKQRCDLDGDSLMGFLLQLQSEESLSLMIKRECELLPRGDYSKRLMDGEMAVSVRGDAIDWITKVVRKETVVEKRNGGRLFVKRRWLRKETVAEMGKIIVGGGAGGRVCVPGTATYATYLRCQFYHATMESEWDLAAVLIAPRIVSPSSRPGWRASGLSC